MSAPDTLQVLYDGIPVGHLTVTARSDRKLYGTFSPGAGFDVCRAAFEEAAWWYGQWEKTPMIPATDYEAWHRWIEVLDAITAHVRLPEVPQTIEEFAVDNTPEVEVTLVLAE